MILISSNNIAKNHLAQFVFDLIFNSAVLIRSEYDFFKHFPEGLKPRVLIKYYRVRMSGIASSFYEGASGIMYLYNTRFAEHSDCTFSKTHHKNMLFPNINATIQI